MVRALPVTVVAALAAVAGMGCVSIHHVDDPTAAIGAARAEAQRLQQQPGHAHRINVLVFDPDDGEMVRVSLPIWLASKFEHQAGLGAEAGRAMDRGVGAELARHITLKELAAAGRGLIADVEDEDGSQVLVWLR